MATERPGPTRSAIDDLRRLEPAIDARVGSADAIPFTRRFDAVLLGFFLYVVDRSLLFRVVSEVDRVLSAGREQQPARLFIFDFDPPAPVCNEYRHRPGLKSWKMNYSSLFIANPDYRILDKSSISSTKLDPDDRVALWTLERISESGYEPHQ